MSASTLQDRLVAVATEAWAGYPHNVRGGQFVGKFESWCVSELRRLGLPPQPIDLSKPGFVGEITFGLETNRYVLGAYGRKEVDVVLDTDASGPLLGISLKASMSSIVKNRNSRWEEMVGDAANLHGRFPMLTLGYLSFLPYRNPKEELIDSQGRPSDAAREIVRGVAAVSRRASATALVSEYEEAAVCFLDYGAKPIAVHPTFPTPDSGLRVEDFFDRLVASYRERNRYLE